MKFADMVTDEEISFFWKVMTFSTLIWMIAETIGVIV